MATPLWPHAPRRARSSSPSAAVVGVLFSAVPAQAAPATSAEAAELVAARGHELEVVTEQFNEARETLDRAAGRRPGRRGPAGAGHGRARDRPGAGARHRPLRLDR